MHELVLEARDQGTPSRAARVPLKITVLDVNDNSPEIVDPQGDVVSVREEQPPGTEVARVRALDTDLGENASVTYTILKGTYIYIYILFRDRKSILSKRTLEILAKSIYTVGWILLRSRLGRLQRFHH